MKHVAVCLMHLASQIRWHLFTGWTGRLAGMQHAAFIFKIGHDSSLLSDHFDAPCRSCTHRIVKIPLVQPRKNFITVLWHKLTSYTIPFTAARREDPAS